MKLFACQSCNQVIFFENTECVSCHHRLGYMPQGILSALEPAGEDEAGRPLWSAFGAQDATLWRFCANAGHMACNWLIPSGEPGDFCLCCRHNRTVPDLDNPDNLSRWQAMELAKHRLFYSLLRFGLPLPMRPENPEGLAFDFLADQSEASGGAATVLTGHDGGLITINLKEADDSEREKLREMMHEPYRTLLGHFRHEIGHFYWDKLVRDRQDIDACRAVFGDESQDYAAALQRHYTQGAPPDWQEHFISTYATSHPWEDFAETWAHYLHIVDTLEMADAVSLRVDPKVSDDDSLSARIRFDSYAATSLDELIDAWVPVTFAINSLNRAMGQNDLYPFVLSPAVIRKLEYVHGIIHAPGESA
ncbi:MAG: putative zinc-binding peptidase [Parvibaculaceae bacterium]|nr:putative zinc-binding peptidase [Parvibaculaceae bacterium]